MLRLMADRQDEGANVDKSDRAEAAPAKVLVTKVPDLRGVTLVQLADEAMAALLAAPTEAENDERSVSVAAFNASL